MPVTDRELDKIRQYLASDKFRKNHDVLRAISGQVRYRIICALAQSKNGLTVSEIAKLFGYSVSRVSHQLRILRKYRIVTMNRNGKSMIYEIVENPFLRQSIDAWRNGAYRQM
ncbi:winged helix-turn-helix transcriptional regulator [Candidatus Uhrbacteria bacterium]|nr:winged helix-turn-helix transcriptional regulator [Candidatus Uhrbacteria bacterium]